MGSILSGTIRIEDATRIKVLEIRRHRIWWWKSEVVLEVDSTNEKRIYDLEVNDLVRVNIDVELANY